MSKMKDEMRSELVKALGILAGFSSMCWEPRPSGVFNSEEAQVGVDNAKAKIEALISQNYIPKEKVLTRKEIEEIIQKEVDKIIENGKSKGKNPTKKLAQAILNNLKEKE